MTHGDLTGTPCINEDRIMFVVDRNMIMEVSPKLVLLDQNVKNEVNILEVN